MSPELESALHWDLSELRFLSALGRTAEADAAPACPDDRQAPLAETAEELPADEFTYPQEPQPQPLFRRSNLVHAPEPIAVPPVPVAEDIEEEPEELPMPKPVQSLRLAPVPTLFTVLPAVLKGVADSVQEPPSGSSPRKAPSASLEVELKLLAVPRAEPAKDPCRGCDVCHKQRPHLLRRVYPIAELLDAEEDHTPEHVIRILHRTVAPDSWEDAGGWGVVDFFPRGKCLIVCQTEEVHEEIASLLAELEAAVQGSLVPGSELRRTRFQEHAPAGQQSPVRASEARPCPGPCHDP
jgi:ferredoxin